MDRYSLDQAKRSLAICDHMNVDIEWLICRIEQLQKENERISEFSREEGSRLFDAQKYNVELFLHVKDRDTKIENLQKENAILREALELAVKSGEFFSRHADCRNDSWSCRCEFCKDNSASKNLREAREALKELGHD